MPRQAVLGHVVLKVLAGPVGERVDLDQTLVVNLDDVDVAALATLCAATASEDRLDVEFAVSTGSRLDLGNSVVELVVRFP